jgi:type I restriction enzyme, S subunit
MDRRQLPEGWKLVTLGEVCCFENGDRGENYPSKSVQTISGIPFINAGHLTDSGINFSDMNYIPKERFEILKKGKIKKEDILFCLRGSLGKVASVENLDEGVIASSLVIVRSGSLVLNKFLLAYFKSSLCAEMIEQFRNGAAQPNLSAASLKKFYLPLPSIEEQKRIVAILDEAFEGIDQAIRNTEKNLANARELFESYLNKIFIQKGEDWEERKLGDSNILQIIDGDRGNNYPKKSDFLDEGFCLFLSTKNVRANGFLFEDRMFISQEKDSQLRKGKLKRRDVILTTRGTIGNIAIYDENVEFEHIRINSGMLIFRPNEKNILSEYLFEILRSSNMKAQIEKFTSGAAQPQLPIKTLINFNFFIPKSLEEQSKIVFSLQEISIETQRLETIYRQKIAALNELKQSILQKAFTGQLTPKSL